jgi:prepilin-type N-terminal cleavage/methylation domain-containing protein
MKKMDNKGFSLVELIVVIAIMAVLMGVLAPTLLGNVEKSKLSKDKSTTDTLYTAFTNAAGDPDYSGDLVGKTYKYEVTNGVLTVSSGTGDATKLGDQTVGEKAAKLVADYVGADKITFTSKSFKGTATITVKVTDSGKVAIYAEGSGGATDSNNFYVNCKDSSAWASIE